jgi:hypothetical protein
MALFTNLNTSPYYDDYSQDKKYLKLLFKPGYAVQARELTQIQSSLQNQIQKFGDHIFRNGSVVTGGQFFLQNATYLKLDSSYSGEDVNYSDFVGKTITSTDLSKRGEVIVGFAATDSDPITLMVKQLYGADFIAGETIITKESSAYSANISTSGVGTGQIFSVNDGVFYYDGYFISVDAQTVATSKYSSNTASARIGFEITESLVNNSSDSSLLDPAQDASNYQAPGADRYKIDLVLSTRALDSEDDDRFIELMQVRNGQSIKENRYPIYSVLEDTFARRTYDESGNYTVRPFIVSIEDNASNTAQTNVILSPGKAYVYGYEYETNSPTTLTIDKPRTTSNVNNKYIIADYGNYVYTTKHYGAFPLNNLTTVDAHCVNTASINTASTGTISNTKIGTVRVKTISFESSANTADANTYVYKTFLFDTNIGSLTGTVQSANSADIQIGTNFSDVDDAYTGAKFRITSGLGSSEGTKTITDYIGSTKTIFVSPGFGETPNASSVFSIDFEFNDAESLANFSSTTRTLSADIDSRSKDNATTYQDVLISDSAYEPLIFNLGEDYIANNTISDMSFSYKKTYAPVLFNTSVATLSLGTGEELAAAISTSSKLENYYIAVTSQETSIYPVGTVIPASLITVSSDTITIPSANDMQATIVATINFSDATKKVKTYVTANTEIQTSGGTNVFGGGNTDFVSYTTQGQAHIAINIVNRIPNNPQSLYVADVTELVEVLDFNGYGISSANVSFSSDITSYYVLDTGQLDSYYNHSAMILKPGVLTPIGPLLVKYNRFTTTTGSGFFSVDSYSGIGYENIPVYESKITNSSYNLRDCVDFRPVKADHTLNNTFNIDSTGPKIPDYGSNIVLDYEYYLPRIDKISLDKTRVFEVIKGTPGLNPLTPQDSSTGMTLYVLRYPPYVGNSSDIRVKQIDHRRYTMRDIGNIDKRVQNLEYYTALTLLEQDTMSKQDLTILDTQNLARFKNGIIVDSFTGHSIADVGSYDYRAAIDPINKELRPTFNVSVHNLTFDSANSSNYTQRGSLVTLTANNVTFIRQPKASKITNVNPFNVFDYLGFIDLYPPTDIWVDDERIDSVLVNLEGDKDAWELIAETPFSYEWGDWNTYWTGVDVNTSVSTRTSGGSSTTTTTTTTTTTENQTRSGIVTYIVPETITRSLGDKVVDVSIIPFMRQINILFVGTSFKPSTVIYPFFEEKSINNNVTGANRFYLSNNNIQFPINYSNPQAITVKNKTTDATLGTGLVVHNSNNIVYVTNVTATTGFDNCKIVGGSLSYDVTSYEHNGGKVQGATANTITLDVHANGAINISTFIGSNIHIVQGIGIGQDRTISNYDSATRVATVSSNWTIIPYSASQDTYYGIGNLTTDESGSIAGVFTVPEQTFRVGEKLFRLMNAESGDLISSWTSGDASFYAQGLIQTFQDTVISTIQPSLRRVSVTDNRTVTNRSTSTEQIEIRTQIFDEPTSQSFYVSPQQIIDPIAQTFFVGSQQYPEGVFLDRIRVCFKTKDDVIPITLQLRPTVNGYPSSSVVYPYSTVTLTPDKVNITNSPDITDSSKYTDFIFPAPVYVQPGECCFVLIANTNKYEAYVAEIGSKNLVDGKLISEQPYIGSYFASQNASTWTADQYLDMMFEIFRTDFTASSGIAQFQITPPTNSVPYSLVQTITSELVLPRTFLNYYYNAEKESGGFVGYQPIISGRDYELIDASGMRLLSNTTGADSFRLKGDMATLTSVLSPVIDVSRTGVIVVENIINNLELSNTGFVIESGGSDYTDAANVVITISGGGGSGATAVANVAGGIIDDVYLTNVGSNYTTSPTITVSTLNATGSGGSIRYIGESEPSGGNAYAKYFCRRVILNEGFNSGDLRVYITAYKPLNTNIYVYYKILSESDIERFEDKYWQLMTQLGDSNFISTNSRDYRELVYAPGVNGVANNSVSYTTTDSSYSTFKTFAIKIVLTSTTPTTVPKVRDFRAIALPAG